MFADLEVTLTEQERAVRDAARRFAEEVLRTAGVTLDRLPDPAQVIAPQSLLWDVFDKYWALDLEILDAGDPEISAMERARMRCLVSEELGWGDAGLAISLGVSNFHKMFAQMSGQPALVERFGGPTNRDIGCWAVTEPDHGSDSLTVTERHFTDPKLKANCVAQRDGDTYILNGQKSAWVSNGTIATVATLFCTIDPSQGFKGGGVCLVPLDSPGVSRRPQPNGSSEAVSGGRRRMTATDYADSTDSESRAAMAADCFPIRSIRSIRCKELQE